MHIIIYRGNLSEISPQRQTNRARCSRHSGIACGTIILMELERGSLEGHPDE